MGRPVYRGCYRACLDTTASFDIDSIIADVKSDCAALIASGSVFVAGLFRYGNQLFAYYETFGGQLAPEALFKALSPCLMSWPGIDGPRKWAFMTPAWFHAVPIDEDDWTREINTERCTGRLAYLKDDMIADYVCSHKQLTNEGALRGDKFTLLSLHENVLFQYMEQLDVLTNVKRDESLVCAYLDPQHPNRPIPSDKWIYPNGSPFAMMPEGGRFEGAQKLFVLAQNPA